MKKSLYYKKDKKAQIYQHKNVASKGSMPIEKYYPISRQPLWCYTSQLSQDRIYQAKGVGSDESRFFVFYYMIDVAVDDAILYLGKWYHITRVDTEDDYNTDIFVYVNDMETVPSDDDILDYETGLQYL